MQTKKAIKTKDKRASKETLGTMQTLDQKTLWKCLLHLWSNGLVRYKLAYRTPVGKSKFGGILEIRLTGSPSAVLPVQYSSRWTGSRILPKNVHNRWARIHRESGQGQTSYGKSLLSLRETNKRLH